MMKSLGRYGNWDLVCKQAISSVSDCGLVQAVRGDKTGDKLSVALTYEQDQHVDARIRIEPPPLRTEGVALLINGAQDEILAPTACDTHGCSGTWIVSSTSLGKLFAGNKLEAQFRVGPEHGSSLAVDLDKLSEGLIAMQNAIPSQITANTWYKQLADGGDWSFSAEVVRWTAGPGGLFEALDPAHPVLCYSPGKKTDVLDSKISAMLNVGQDMTAQPLSYDQTKELTQAAQACGDKVAIIVMSTDSNKPRKSSAYLMQIKKSVVETYLQKLGVDKGQLIATGDGNQGVFGGSALDEFGSWDTIKNKP